MGYKLNPDVWNSVFAIPTSIADEHLRRVNGQQLKVLIYLFRFNGNVLSPADIGGALGMSEADVKDAVQYWLEAGYVYEDGSAPTAVKTVSPKAEAPLVEVPDVLPTYDQVAARTLESPEIRGLFNEVQARLAKTIGYDSQSRLLMMIDSYGLPPEVILTIVEYAVKHGKPSLSYICKVGKNWAENGIDTLEAAVERLNVLEQQETMWKQFVSQFQTTEPPKATEKRVAFLRKWRGEWKQSNELIYYAYEEMINNIDKVNFKYLDKILENWNAQGLKTPQAVLQNSGAPKKPATPAEPKETSYDSDAYKQKARGPIEYKRRDS